MALGLPSVTSEVILIAKSVMLFCEMYFIDDVCDLEDVYEIGEDLGEHFLTKLGKF
jgi:hypothetical protein